jgi:hypothetical protein
MGFDDRSEPEENAIRVDNATCLVDFYMVAADAGKFLCSGGRDLRNLSLSKGLRLP